MPKALKLFISYAHADEAMKSEMDKHLIGLKRSNKIAVWQDRMLIGGDSWNDTIRKELMEADIILLLIRVDLGYFLVRRFRQPPHSSHELYQSHQFHL